MKNNISPFDAGITLRPGETIAIDGRISKEWEENKKALREIRGNIISLTIEIELILDKIIKTLFFKDEETDIVKIFDNFVLKERPLTFSSKIRLLERIVVELKIELDDKDLIKKLDKIRDIRNRFSHNTVAFLPVGEVPDQKLIPRLTCYDKEIILDNNYFDMLNKLYAETSTNLNEFLKKLTKK